MGWHQRTRRRPWQEIAVLQNAARDGLPQVLLLEPHDALGVIRDQEQLALLILNVAPGGEKDAVVYVHGNTDVRRAALLCSSYFMATSLTNLAVREVWASSERSLD